MTVTEAEHKAAIEEKKWALTEASDGSWHVHPLGDSRGHYIERGGDCWCRPRSEEDGRFFVHNSADGREEDEHRVH
jgi:hypothetical protein